MESDLPAELFTAKNCVAVHSDEELIKALEDAGVRTVSIRNGDREETHCIALQKFLEKGQLLFVTNYHRTEDCEVEIHVPLEASVEEWDALTGTHNTGGSCHRTGADCFSDTVGSTDFAPVFPGENGEKRRKISWRKRSACRG